MTSISQADTQGN